MDPLVLAHVASAAALVVVATMVAAWGMLRARAIGGGRATQRESRGFAQLLQLSHTLVLVVGLVGLVLVAAGHGTGDPLHARVYGPFMVVAIVAAYGFRTADHVANIRVFAIASLVILALALRAVWTGHP